MVEIKEQGDEEEAKRKLDCSKTKMKKKKTYLGVGYWFPLSEYPAKELSTHHKLKISNPYIFAS